MFIHFSLDLARRKFAEVGVSSTNYQKSSATLSHVACLIPVPSLKKQFRKKHSKFYMTRVLSHFLMFAYASIYQSVNHAMRDK